MMIVLTGTEYLRGYCIRGLHWLSEKETVTCVTKKSLPASETLKVTGIRPLAPVQNTVSLKLLQRKTLSFVLS